MTDRLIRVRAFLDAYLFGVCALFVVLALLGGWLTYGAYVDPGTTVEQRSGPSWGSEGRFVHGATVVEGNPVYPVDATLSNRSIYFTDVTPRLDGAYAVAYNASGGGSVDVTMTHTLVHEAVEGDGTVVWRRTERLNRSTVESVGPGETVQVPFSVNASALINRTEQIQDKLGGLGEVRAVVRTAVHVQGEVNGQAVERRWTSDLSMTLRGDVYRVDAPAPVTDSNESTVSVPVEATPDPLASGGGPLLLLTSLGGLGGLLLLHHRGRLAPTARERRRLAYEDTRSDFEEWITAARLPPECTAQPRVDVTSLEGLVDLAIDTDSRVIHDADQGTYCVLHDGFRYEYVPPVDGDRPSQASLDGRWVRDESATIVGNGGPDEPEE